LNVLETIKPKILVLSPMEKISIIGIAGGFVNLVGGFDQSMQTLALFITIDYVTGVLLALYKNSLSSEECYKGIIKKAIIFLVVVLAHHTDMVFKMEPLLLRSCTIVFYIGNEGISILENIGEMGVPLPRNIRKVLSNLKEKEGGNQ